MANPPDTATLPQEQQTDADPGKGVETISPLVQIAAVAAPKPEKGSPQDGKGRYRASAGSPARLGAVPTDTGVNFAVYSKHAREVFLVLFDRPEGPQAQVIKMADRTGDVWHVHVDGLAKGQLYGFRAKGDYDPPKGLRFNENKLLVDPYAKAFTGKFKNTDNLLLAYDGRSGQKDLSRDARDNAAVVPKCIVWDDAFDWQGDKPPAIPQEKLVIYEVHVKGFTAHPTSGVAHPGTYLGFIEKIPYLKELGVNSVELLPVHEYRNEDFLEEKGLKNYWGYNTVGYFAAESSYASGNAPGCAIDEFKTMVRELHKAGIEVILDVVYNHTAEGNECGPTLSFKGLDNPSYYSLCGDEESPLRYYRNFSGTGNTLNASSPAVIRMVLDSLHYWAEVMHVDGFRFDLAACLGRDAEGVFSACGHLLGAISEDPLLSKLKLIAEPWDMEAYEVGNLPMGWSEWNGKFRDCIRKAVKGDGGQLREMASRLSGSADLFEHNGRAATDSINFLTCHDGFTLYDLVAYSDKHNEANLEDNKDGANDNNSWNCGVEGETDDENINAFRRRQVKNFFCYQMLSLGTPMITAGDEFMRTQKGNNNVYAQDNGLAWMDWDRLARQQEVFRFVRKLIAFRQGHSVLQRRKFLNGQDTSGDGIPDVTWIGSKDGAMHWDDAEARSLAFQIDGAETDPDSASEALGTDCRLFIAFNAGSEAQDFPLPAPDGDKKWLRVIDTSLPSGEDFADEGKEAPIETPNYLLTARSCILLMIRK